MHWFLGRKALPVTKNRENLFDSENRENHSSFRKSRGLSVGKGSVALKD
jgi:hypothetical protein